MAPPSLQVLAAFRPTAIEVIGAVRGMDLELGLRRLPEASGSGRPGFHQGSWFYGGTIYLLRADLQGVRERKARRVAVADRTASPEPVRSAA